MNLYKFIDDTCTLSINGCKLAIHLTCRSNVIFSKKTWLQRRILPLKHCEYRLRVPYKVKRNAVKMSQYAFSGWYFIRIKSWYQLKKVQTKIMRNSRIEQKYYHYYIQSFMSYPLAVYHGVSCSFEYLGEI